MPVNLAIRKLEATDQLLLAEMMYQALFIPEGETPPPKKIIWEPKLSKYHAQWGVAGDMGLVAEDGNQAIGAIWCRQFKRQDQSYGFVDQDTPEMIIAVEPGFRNQGIGSALIEAMINMLKAAGIKGISLSVQKANRALRLYNRLGFNIVKEEGTAFTMLKQWECEK